MLHLRLSRFVCIFLIGLILASCGSPGTTSSTNSMTLNVAQISNGIGFFPLYVARQENYFNAQGLTLSPPVPLQTGTGAKMASAIEAGSIEVAGGGIITDAFTLSKVDPRVRLLGALATGYFVDITVSKSFEQHAHLSATSSLADKVKALVGKKIGITAPGSGTEALLTYLFRLYGYNDQRDATLVSIGAAPAGALIALSSGRIDAVSFVSPLGEQAETQGIGDIFISPDRGDVPAMQGQLHGVIYARQNVIDAKPKAVQAFIRAIAQAESFIQKNPKQAAILLKKYLQLDPKTTQAVLAATMLIMPPTPRISQQGFDTANQFHVKVGLLAKATPYNNIVASSTIDSALSGLSGSS